MAQWPVQLRVADEGGCELPAGEVGEVLLGAPGVAEAAVVGAPDAQWGEIVVACVLAQPGARIDADALDAFCLQHIARFKRPKRHVFVDALPKNRCGKVLKTPLRERLRRWTRRCTCRCGAGAGAGRPCTHANRRTPIHARQYTHVPVRHGPQGLVLRGIAATVRPMSSLICLRNALRVAPSQAAVAAAGGLAAPVSRAASGSSTRSPAAQS